MNFAYTALGEQIVTVGGQFLSDSLDDNFPGYGRRTDEHYWNLGGILQHDWMYTYWAETLLAARLRCAQRLDETGHAHMDAARCERAFAIFSEIFSADLPVRWRLAAMTGMVQTADQRAAGVRPSERFSHSAVEVIDEIQETPYLTLST